jgi:transcriptional regulator with XRE-family HTH domain
MTPETKQRLARQNDTGLAASAIRLRAARKLAGKDQREMAAECNVKNTVLSNAENGQTYPSREILSAYWRGYRIDFNFLINGDFAQLPLDLQERLFPALEDATNEWDRKENSGRSSGGSPPAQQRRLTSRA